MRNAWILLPVIGCSEYAINEPLPPPGEANAAELDNPIKNDRIVQVTTPSVDILWIIDDSGSMGNEQTQLAQNFPAFMPYILDSGLNYHIGVVSTDMRPRGGHGRLVPADNGDQWIDNDSAAPIAMFQQMSQLGTNGSSDECGREAGYTALELLGNTDNQGFLRDDRGTGAHVIVVSDEPDGSNPDVITKAEFIDWMNNLRPDDPELATFSSIVNPPDVGPLVGLPGTDYLELTDGIGGIKWPIHTDNWIAALEQLSIQAAGLKREYFLSELPVAETIEVQVHEPDGTIVVDQKWEYSGTRNSVTFESYVPLPLSEVLIQYTVLSSMYSQSDVIPEE
jgi:hypothetical protein